MVTVTMNFEQLDRSVDMVPKERNELSDCPIDRIVSLSFQDGRIFHGYFRGIDYDDDEVTLRSLSSPAAIGLPLAKLTSYLEEIVEHSPLTFDHFRSINLERALLWHKGGLQEWTVSDWAVATAGECGEICDAVKKLRRIECAVESKNARQPENATDAILDIAKEIGDTAVYLDLLSQRLGLKLEDCIRNTFNRISEREGMPQRL